MEKLPMKLTETLPTVAIEEDTKKDIVDLANCEGRYVCAMHRKALVYVGKLHRSGKLKKDKLWNELKYIK